MATWGGAKTDYQPSDPLTNTDVNRREENLEYLKDEADSIRTDYNDNINQGVKTTDSPVFANMAAGSNNNQDLRTSASPTFNALTVTTINTGHGNNEVYAMNQDVQTTASPTFAGLTLTTPSAYSQTISTSPVLLANGIYFNLYFTIVSTGGLGTTVTLNIQGYTGGAWQTFYTLEASSNATEHYTVPILYSDGVLVRYTRSGTGNLSVTGYKY